jgi:hypothetical protein
MALAEIDFRCDAGADWQRVIRLRDPGTGQLVALSDAAMEIRNANFQLALRLDNASGRCVIASDKASIQLHIPPEDSIAVFQTGNYPGTYQAVGFWGIGRSYLYDLFVIYATGVQDRILRGYFNVDPNVTRKAS